MNMLQQIESAYGNILGVEFAILFLTGTTFNKKQRKKVHIRKTDIPRDQSSFELHTKIYPEYL